MLQAGLLAGFVFQTKSQGGYQTASAPATAPGEGSYVLIRFQPQATAADIASFLEANKLSIVGGPAGGQLFQVRVAPTKLSQADLDPHRQHAAERQSRRLHRRNKLR